MIAAAPMAIAAALSLAVACLWYWLQSVPPVTLRASYLPPPALARMQVLEEACHQ